MGTMTLLTIISGLLLVLLFISGVRLRLAGEPYKKPILTAHRLISLVVIVLLVIVVIQHLREMEFGALGWLFTILAGVFTLVAFGTGGALTKEKTGKDFLKKIHRISSLLAVIMIPVIWLYCH